MNDPQKMTPDEIFAAAVAKSRAQHANVLPAGFTVAHKPAARTRNRRWVGTYPTGKFWAATRDAVEDHLFMCALNPAEGGKPA